MFTFYGRRPQNRVTVIVLLIEEVYSLVLGLLVIKDTLKRTWALKITTALWLSSELAICLRVGSHQGIAPEPQHIQCWVCRMHSIHVLMTVFLPTTCSRQALDLLVTNLASSYIASIVAITPWHTMLCSTVVWLVECFTCTSAWGIGTTKNSVVTLHLEAVATPSPYISNIPSVLWADLKWVRTYSWEWILYSYS